MLLLRDELPADGPQIETLLDTAFGCDRQKKISYRYRDGVAPVRDLCMVALEDGQLVGTIRYWPILLAGAPALLLGPVATDPSRRSLGIGRALIAPTLGRAESLGWNLVLLVGDPPYYRRFGFTVAPSEVVMPDENPARLQWQPLGGAILPSGGGLLTPAHGLVEPGQHRLADGQQALVA